KERGEDYPKPVDAGLSLLLVIRLEGNVVEIGVTQLNVRPLELGWQRLEGIRRAHGRERGAVQRLLPRVALDHRLVGRHAAVLHDSKREHNYAPLTKLDGPGHDCKPIALHRNINALEIAVEIHALIRREHLQAPVGRPSPASAPACTTAGKLAAPSYGPGTGRASGSQRVLNALVR